MTQFHLNHMSCSSEAGGYSSGQLPNGDTLETCSKCRVVNIVVAPNKVALTKLSKTVLAHRGDYKPGGVAHYMSGEKVPAKKLSKPKLALLLWSHNQRKSRLLKKSLGKRAKCVKGQLKRVKA